MSIRFARRALLAGLAALALSPAAAAAEAPVTIFTARRIITMEPDGGAPHAVAVRDGRILALGEAADLSRRYPDARTDMTFAGKVLVPGLIDPHIHVVLGGLMYAQPFATPWPMATPTGPSKGYPTRQAFLARLREIVAQAPADGSPVVVYGFHNLVQGELDRHDLDAISPDRPLVVWHYSGHDFYLSSKALEAIGATPALAARFHGVDLDAKGELTGRIYEDAGLFVVGKLGGVLLNPQAVRRGTQAYFGIMRAAGVTTTAELAYGSFGLAFEDKAISENWSIARNAFRLYLIPEHRAFKAAYGEAAPQVVTDLVAGRRAAPAPVLPRVKFFADGAYYSQTMRLSPPGYLAGQSKGTEGLWVIPEGQIAATMRPYFAAGLSAHIHSNGDAAQDSTLKALAELRAAGFRNDFVIEHGGLFSPDEVARAGRDGAMVSAASHYVRYLAETYAAPLGEARKGWISPLADLEKAGVPVALHSDAPLAPPEPLRAASVQMTRQTREGGVYRKDEALSAAQALRAVTLDAARVLGLQGEIGSLAPGKRADMTVLDADPLETPAKAWPKIGVWGVVLDGVKRPVGEPVS